jgi:transcriptional regulator with XRE-family HTH domain
MSGLGNLIQSEIKRREWSLRDLAAHSGITASTLSDIINYPDRTPALRTLAALSAALNLPLRQLIEACGFPVEDAGATADQGERARALLSAVPELQSFVEDIASLDADDREGVLVYIETLLKRKQRKQE